MLKNRNNYLVLIIVLAMALRLTGIAHSFPFIFHPDEPTIVRSALGIRFYPNPKHFDWPHLYIYLNYFLYMAFAKVRGILELVGAKQTLAFLWDDTTVFYLVTRVLSAILGALTVIPVYLAGKTLFGKVAGLFGALAFALLPYHVWHSHYSLPDVPMTFFLAWGMYFSCRILLSAQTRNYIFAGLLFGLAASTKYNGALGLSLVPLAHLLRTVNRTSSEKIVSPTGFGKLCLAGVAAAAAFVAGTPYALLDFANFVRTDGPQGALWQFSNVGSLSFVAHLNQLLVNLTSKLPDDMGYTILLGFLVLGGWLVYKAVSRNFGNGENGDAKKLLLLLLPALTLIYYISGFEKSRSHYFFVVYPMVAVCFGYVTVKLSSLFRNKRLYALVCTLLFLPPLVTSVIGSLTFLRGDTRQILYAWGKKNIAETEAVVYVSKSLAEVVKQFSQNAHLGLDDLQRFRTGYLIISSDDLRAVTSSYNPRAIRGSARQGASSYNIPMRNVLTIPNSMRTGPQLYVFTFGK